MKEKKNEVDVSFMACRMPVHRKNVVFYMRKANERLRECVPRPKLIEERQTKKIDTQIRMGEFVRCLNYSYIIIYLLECDQKCNQIRRGDDGGCSTRQYGMEKKIPLIQSINTCCVNGVNNINYDDTSCTSHNRYQIFFVENCVAVRIDIAFVTLMEISSDEKKESCSYAIEKLPITICTEKCIKILDAIVSMCSNFLTDHDAGIIRFKCMGTTYVQTQLFDNNTKVRRRNLAALNGWNMDFI